MDRFWDNLLRIEAEGELARRSLSGSLAQICAFLILLFLTSLWRDQQTLMGILGFVLVLSNVLRFSIARYQDNFYPEGQLLWGRLFDGLVFVAGLAWGTLALAAIKFYGLGHPTSTMVLLTAAGMAAGGTMSLSPSEGTALRFTLTTQLIPMCYLFTHIERTTLPLGISMVVYLFFLRTQIRVQNREYWQLLYSRKSIAEDRNRLQTVLDAIPGFVSWVGPDLCYKGINRNLADLLGMTASELLGKRIGFMNPGNAMVQAVEKFVVGPNDDAALEMLVNTPKGPRWHLLVMHKGSFSSDERHGNAAETYIIAIDIHDLRMAEHELKEQRTKAEYSAKLASLGEMAGGVAHEINNPLTIIQAIAEELEMQGESGKPNPERVASAARQIETTVNRIAKIIRGLRAFARDADRDPLHSVSLRKIVDDTLAFCQTRFKSHGVELEVGPISGDLSIVCRPVQISQVLLNLLNNAFDAVDPLESKWIRLEVEDRGNRIALKVMDNGKGVPEAIRDRIMDPFFTTKEVGKGTGLGLSISKGIIESHSGQFYLDPTSPHTCFVAELPKSPTQASREAA